MIKAQTTLYYRNGTSDKVYQVTLEETARGHVVNIAYGRRGAALQAGTKTAAATDYAAAQAIYDRLVKEKLAKGYTPGEDGVPYAHTAHANQNTGLQPQLLNAMSEALVRKLIRDPQWWLQQKHDGKRLLVQKQGSTITGINRRGLIVALPAPLVEDVQPCTADLLLDGELLGDRYIVFDLLQFGGNDLRPLPYLERYLTLMQLMGYWQRQYVRLVESACTDLEKRKKYLELVAHGAEGVVFKHLQAPYADGRPASGGDALKYKFYDTASFIVSGHNPQRSVSLRLYDQAPIRRAGRVAIPPNHDIPPVGAVVEVRYLYAFAESGCIYQPVYLGVRDDMGPEDCTEDQLKYKVGGEEAAA